MQLQTLTHTLSHSKLFFKRPKVIPRALIGTVLSAVFKKDRLKTVEFVINSECDSKCVMCYATRYVKEDDIPLSAVEIGRIWKECEKLGAFIAALEGGEPTLRKDLDEIVRALDPWRNIVVLVSNSLGLTYEKLKHYKTIGISVLHLSLDGTTPQENDSIRGIPGHFNKVMQAVEIGKKLGFKVYFSTVLKHSNKEGFLKIIKLAQKLDVGISGALLVTTGRYEGMQSERLTQEDRLWLLNVLKQYASIVRFDWNDNFSLRYECPAGREKFSVSLYGEIMACVCNHLSFGNVRNESVRAIWNRMRDFRYFKERNPLCLVGFETEYYKKYIEPIDSVQTLPVSILKHPMHPAKLAKGKIIDRQD